MRRETRGGWVALGVCVLVASALLGLRAPRARGQDLAFAGSVQASYLFSPTSPADLHHAFDGFTTEASLKVSADVGDHVSAQVKACFGCHGFELGMAFVDFRVADELNLRVGRFSPSFGEFPLRHDPANHHTVDKPLVYDMGRMLRMREWNLGILPIPYVDQGIEVNGTHWCDGTAQVDYAVYVVGGLRGTTEPFDIDWIETRSLGRYYVDDNASPAGGARVGFAFNLGEEAALSFGASGMYGLYDPDATRSYLIVGADLYARWGPLTLRAEYLLRRTEFALGDDPASRFAYGPGENGQFDDFFLKDGWYADVEIRLHPAVELIGRFDGLRRIGNVAATSPLRSESMILRYTAGFNFIPDRAFRIKLFSQLYDFSDFADEVTIQAAVAANF
ncbi:hypothetical protein [Sandaracinus amylolyticus]|uniref:hypothetical protein n=1 Tax=Sandaracinus amylolyticus TaxID=927083 RepID=UPI001F274160|nr:hypothetical protein [Sandaracinus amylolyticus]UJR83293.1 Hypothetical protein I5071_53610 [Sandaracinus amylolyticus]